MELRSFRYPDDLPAQRSLFFDAFPEHQGSTAGSEAHYNWKYRQFPWVDPAPPEFVATEEGSLLGYYAALPYRYRLSGRKARVGVVCDVMTHPQARDKGVFTRLGRYALAEMGRAGVDVAVAFPVRPPSLGGLKKMGFEEAFSLPVYIAPLRVHSLFRELRLGMLVLPAMAALALYRGILRPRSKPTCPVRALPREEFFGRADHDPSFRSRFEDLHARWSATFTNCMVKDLEFLRWRLGAPGADYTFHLLAGDERWEALAITRCADLKHVPTCSIVDWMAPEERRDGHEALLASVFAHAEATASELVATLMPPHLARRRHLGRMGFLRSPLVFHFVTQVLHPAGLSHDLTDPKRWSLMWIDSDDL